MKPKINTNLDFAPLPETFDDDRRNLNILNTIQNALNDDLAIRGEYANRSIKQTRRDWVLLWPSFEEAEAETLEELRDVHAQGRLLDSLEKRVLELGRTANTLNKRLDSMLAGLKRAGLEDEHRGRLKNNLTRVKRASGFEDAKAKGYTMAEWGATAKAADAIVANPESFTYNTYHTKFTKERALMNRASIWLTVIGANRISETLSIKTDEVSKDGFYYYVKKARNYPEKKFCPMPAECWEHVSAYLATVEDELLFPVSSDVLTKTARATMLEAGLTPHNGRLGLHGFRHLFTSHSLANDYGSVADRQHMLGHKSPETQQAYTQEVAKQASVDRVSAPFHDAVVDAAGCTFEWNGKVGSGYYEAMFKHEVPMLPQDSIGDSEVIYDGKTLTLGYPVCYHNSAVMMPLLENGETIEWAILEVEGPNAMVAKPIRMIVKTRSIGWARPDLNRSPDRSQAAFFEGYRAALEDMGESPSK